jgi:Domain of unknown function (DUF5047)
MQSSSDDFKKAIRNSHVAISKVVLKRDQQVLVDDLPVLTGSVSDDSSALVRRRCTLTLPGVPEVLDLLPKNQPSDGGLWPLGNELELFGGIKYGTGVEEYIPMGVFRIAKPVLQDSGEDLTISIEGYDRGRSISRAKFTAPYFVALGTNYADAIKALAQVKGPWLTADNFRFMETSYETPSLVFTDADDPWQMMIDMAESFGAELFFDGVGNLVLQPQSDPVFTPPDFDYSEGEEATITSIGRDLDDEEAYNGVIFMGETTDNVVPVRAEVWDTNPASPTYYDPKKAEASVYGPVPDIQKSQLITTQAQADEAAAARFSRVMGVIEKIDFTAINNPTHFSGDIISVSRDRINVDSIYVLEGITMGLGANTTMSGTTRKRRAS